MLVMAKAPVPGEAKTRLGAVVGDAVAAELAAASILDTLDVCEAVFPGAGLRHVALAGDLCAAARSAEIMERLGGWTVHPQRGVGFAERLANAHADVARATGAGVVQLGMDTPHLSRADLADVADRLGVGNDVVLGPAEDGGWWVLAVTDARFAQGLREVAMSTEHTYEDTLTALRRAGAFVAGAARLRDVDTPADASAVAATATGTRFAAEWTRATGVSERRDGGSNTCSG